MPKCKICGKEIINTETAFKVKRTYYCSEKEYNTHIENENTIKEGREILYSLFFSKLTVNNIVLLNNAIKSIYELYGSMKFKLLAIKCKEILDGNKTFTDMEQNNKIKYLVAVMNNNIEKIKAQTVSLEIDVTHIDYNTSIKEIKPDNKMDISFMLDKYGGN